MSQKELPQNISAYSDFMDARFDLAVVEEAMKQQFCTGVSPELRELYNRRKQALKQAAITYQEEAEAQPGMYPIASICHIQEVSGLSAFGLEYYPLNDVKKVTFWTGIEGSRLSVIAEHVGRKVFQIREDEANPLVIAPEGLPIRISKYAVTDSGIQRGVYHVLPTGVETPLIELPRV